MLASHPAVGSVLICRRPVLDGEVASAFVFPDLADLVLVTRFALSLAHQPDWTVTRSAMNGTPGGEVVAFNITRTIPRPAGACPSEALMLGPFGEFPATRRAPVTALELFVGLPPAQQQNGQPLTKAHLALVPLDDLPHEKVFERMWKATKESRLRSLGEIDDPRAKAKVAFVIPVALATQLGCLP